MFLFEEQVIRYVDDVGEILSQMGGSARSSLQPFLSSWILMHRNHVLRFAEDCSPGIQDSEQSQEEEMNLMWLT